MKSILLLSGLICIRLSLFAHDLQLAVVSIEHQGNEIVCTLRGDRIELMKELDYKLDNESIQLHADKHLKVAFNDLPVTIKYVKHELSEDFLTIKYIMKTTTHYPKHVRVTADFLLAHVDGHANRIFLQLNQKKRSFLVSEPGRSVIAYY